MERWDLLCGKMELKQKEMKVTVNEMKFWSFVVQSRVHTSSFTFCDRPGGRIDQEKAPGVMNKMWGNVTAFTWGADNNWLIPFYSLSLALRAVYWHLPAMVEYSFQQFLFFYALHSSTILQFLHFCQWCPTACPVGSLWKLWHPKMKQHVYTIF